MLNRIKSNKQLFPFFTENLLEHGYGVIIDESMPQDSYVAINIDDYYRHLSLKDMPKTVDRLLVAQKLSQKELHHIYIIEMKNIKRARYFRTKDIYEKFLTTIEDFMKTRYADIFMDRKYKVERFRLFFVSDPYGLFKKLMTATQERFFINGINIKRFHSIPPFQYRDFMATIEYQLPNPLLEWY